MAFFAHYFSTLVYVAIGYVVAFLLEQRYPEIGLHLAYAYGGLATLLLLLLHTLRSLGMARRQLGRRIENLCDAQEATEDELESARKDLLRIHETISGARKVKGAKKDTEQGLEDVVAEVKVLQDLIGQLSPAAPEPAVAAAASQPAHAAAMPPAEHDAAGIFASAFAADPNAGTEPVPASVLNAAPAMQATPGPAASPPPEEVQMLAPTDLGEAEILTIVREALKADRVELVLQPIVRLPQRKRKYYECFSRIQDGAGRIVMPEQYLDIARRAGLIAPIDNMLLFRCVQLVRRVRKAQQDVGFFCNISSHTLADTPFLRDFIAFMAENVELAPNLVFEFAQDDIANMSEDVAVNLQKLAELGFRFSIDQVAGLNMDYAELARHRFCFVKVDAAVMLDMIRAQTNGTGPAPQLGDIDLRDFKDQLDRVGIDLIVEKIENERDLVELLDFSIDFGQGYLFGEPRRARAA